MKEIFLRFYCFTTKYCSNDEEWHLQFSHTELYTWQSDFSELHNIKVSQTIEL